MKSLILALVALVWMTGSADAHRLRVFATVEAGEIVGYAFFTGGGGRPSGATLTFSRDGRTLHEATTDADGAFRWRPTTAGPVMVVVDAGEGHRDVALLSAERFGATAGTAALDPAIEAAIEAAVARQISPLLEAATVAQSRLRFNDVVGGIGMIVGLFGVALWLTARRQRQRPPP